MRWSSPAPTLRSFLALIVGGIAVADEHRRVASHDKQADTSRRQPTLGVADRRLPHQPAECRQREAVDPELKINWNAWKETWRIVQFAREERSVFLSILGISWFWFFGSAMTIQIPAYTLDVLNGNETITTLLLAAFAIGVGIGSLFCERMSGHRIELGLVPFGSIGLSLFAIDLYFAQPEARTIARGAQSAAFLGTPGWPGEYWSDLAC